MSQNVKGEKTRVVLYGVFPRPNMDCNKDHLHPHGENLTPSHLASSCSRHLSNTFTQIYLPYLWHISYICHICDISDISAVSVTFSNSESDALPPCQLVQSAAVQAARGRPRLHPDGLRRHHQERLRRRGLHVTQHSARWKQKPKHEFKISKKNHKERKCCCRRCGARFLVGGKLPRVETSSLASYVPEEERWVSVSHTVWFLASFRSGLGTQARCQVPRLTWKWVGETDLVPQALGNNFKQPLESKTRALAQNCCIMCSLHVIHQLVVADHPEDSFSFLFYLFSLSLTSSLLQTTLFWGLFFSFSFLFYLLSHQLVVADHPVLRTLEVRTSDKAAQDFVRRQRARMAE